MELNQLSEACLQSGLLTKEQLLTACQKISPSSQSFVSYLIEQYAVDPLEIAQIASKRFDLPLFDLKTFDLKKAPISLVGRQWIQEFQALPLYQGAQRLFVALCDPTHKHALKSLQTQTGLQPECVLVDHLSLTQAILKIAPIPNKPTHSLPEASEELSIVSWLDQLLLEAVKQGASDLHFEPYENNYRVRVRLDGVLKEVTNLPVSTAVRVAARIKVLSQLDISERRLPQDGRFKISPPEGQPIDFRVNSCPTLFGEKVVIRLLDPNRLILDLPSLGYEPFQEAAFLEHIHRTQGMVLVTGPTGSGKTMSLYTALNFLNTPSLNISTAEDPVEIHMPGLNQVPIQSKIGLSFSTALQAFLRQDPDVMMIGEIRDLETAEMAVQASQTGHLVLSTLHTNNAAETLTRLMSLGVSAFNLATAVTLIIAQRLVRRLCNQCKKRGAHDSYEAVGCTSCNGGYKGRIGVYEVMPITSTLAQVILSGRNALDISKQARAEGVQFLYESGLQKVRQGITSLEEIRRVLL